MSAIPAASSFIRIGEIPEIRQEEQSSTIVLEVPGIVNPRITMIDYEIEDNQRDLTRVKCSLLFLTLMTGAVCIVTTYYAFSSDVNFLAVSVPTGIFSAIFARSYVKKACHD